MRTIRRLGWALIMALFLIIAYQNCSEGFKASRSQAIDTNSVQDPTPEPQPTPDPDPIADPNPPPPTPPPSPAPVPEPPVPPYQIVGTSYYVSQSGSDSNVGTAPDKPFKTIAKASSMVQPGDAVLIMAGDYREGIVPPRSGAAGKPIVYKNYGSGRPKIVGGSGYQANLKDRQHIIIDGIAFENAIGGWINMGGGAHLRVTNCTFKRSENWNGIAMTGTSYSRFDHNKLDAVCTASSRGANEGSNGGPDNLLDSYGNMHHNIIEDNEFGNATHYPIDIQGGWKNIIRRNRIRSPWHAGIGLYSGSGAMVEDNVVEDNVITDVGTEQALNYCENVGNPSTSWQPWNFVAIHISSSNNIVRRNLILRNGSIDLVPWGRPTFNNRIYHNTFSENVISVYLWWDASKDIGNNLFVNNIFNRETTMGIYGGPGGPGQQLFINNNFASNKQNKWRSNSMQSLSTIQAAYPSELIDNFIMDPKFANESGGDYRLQPNSGMIDRGVFLTTVVSGGQSSSLKVADSYYFTDGFGIVPGDTIRLEGSNEALQVTGVDRATHTLTLSKSVSSTRGQGVALYYTGKAPDLGAFEFN